MVQALAASDRDTWKKADRAMKRAFLLGYAQRCGCADCGETDPRVLEFDHRGQDTKLRSVSHLVSFNYSVDAILREIKKCEIRCANCHRIRTGKQLGWYQGFEKWLN